MEAVDEEESAVDLRSTVSAREGTLELLDKKGKGKRWMFRLTGLNLEYYKVSGSSAKLEGCIDLDACTGCRSDSHPVAGTVGIMLIECQGGLQYYLKADSEDEVRDWIKRIWDALSAKQEAAEVYDQDDEGYEGARMLEHRFRMLQKRGADDFGSPEAFLKWRQRQIVVFASGMSHMIDCYRAYRSNYDASLEAVQRKLEKQWQRLLEKETGREEDSREGPATVWTEEDDRDYRERLDKISRLVEEAYETARRASTDGESYMEWYPLAVSTVLYEHTLLKSCFEDPEDGGDVRLDAEATYALLQKTSSRLGYVPGMHDVCFAMAVLRQYGLAKDPMQLELLEEKVRDFDRGTAASELRCVHDQYAEMQRFCEAKLLDYHTVEDSSHIAHFVEVFLALKHALPEGGATDDETVLSRFIESSIEKNYEVVRARAATISEGREEEEGKQTEMQRFAVFVEELQEEMDAELIEYAAYIGIHHPAASGVAGKKMAALLNKDVAHHFDGVDVTKGDVMETWQQLRGMEMKIVQAMESVGYAGADAKVLKVDDAMSDVATQWVEDQTKTFTTRMKTAVDAESWVPVSEDEYMAASALDIFSMLVQVAKGYFDAEFPVAEPVMKDLAMKFGSILQMYCRICLQQCKEIPNIHAGREAVKAVGLEGGLQTAGKLGNMLGGKALEAAKQAKLAATGLIDEEAAAGMSEEAMAEATFQWSGPDLTNLAVRFGTVQYMSEACAKLMQMIVEGAARQNYTGAPLDKEMDKTKAALKEHGKNLAAHIGAHIVCIKLRQEFCVDLYVPAPTESPFQQLFDALDETMDEVMMRIPPDYTKFVIQKVRSAPPLPRPNVQTLSRTSDRSTNLMVLLCGVQVLDSCVEVLTKHVNGWRTQLSRGTTPT